MKVYIIWQDSYGGVFSSPPEIIKIYATKELAETRVLEDQWITEEEVHFSIT